MSVGILLITHNGIGDALLNVAQHTFGNLPLSIGYLPVNQDSNPILVQKKASNWIEKLDSGQGVLIMTDMYGSTPSNIAHQLRQEGYPVRIISGLNLPMLFRILNYPSLSLTHLARKAISGAKKGVIETVTLRHSNKKLKTKLMKTEKNEG